MALAVCEVGTRIYLKLTREIQPIACKQQDAILHHSYIPNTFCRYKTAEWDTRIKINSLGLRNKEIKTEKDDGVFRILALGDSFTAAESVESSETAMALLEKMLNQKDRGVGRVEVINAGVPSYSPLLEYLYLREFGFKLNPDLVILNFDLGDVSGENFMYKYYLADKKTLNPDFSFKDSSISGNIWGETLWQQKINTDESIAPFVMTGVKAFLHQHSKFYELVSVEVKRILRGIKGIPPLPIYQLGEVENDFEYVTRSEMNANDLPVYEKPLFSLKLIKDFLDKKQIPFVVFVFPH
ncbi:hypothetical protein HY085_02215, partial [Candidatus Gottesmanbacteria bacterium]|nr:hypothetical protein [Candidatus Gottesmanbacteria bacterium]